MSKKHRTHVPQFGSTRTPARDAKLPSAPASKHSPTTAQRPKPPATSAKSGRRGQ